MQRRHFEYKTTIATLLAEPAFFEAGERSLRRSRDLLEAYILEDPVFLESHLPVSPQPGADALVVSMAAEAAKVGVGPMAAVAGAFAETCLCDMRGAGAEQAVVDNGGDIAFLIKHRVRVGIYAGASQIRDLAFELEPRPDPFGICTSSGTVGPSFSYGRTDAAVVVSRNTVLADAAATALGNRVRFNADLKTCFDFLETIEEIEGALVILGDRIALWGNLPRLVRAEIQMDRISRGKKPAGVG